MKKALSLLLTLALLLASLLALASCKKTDGPEDDATIRVGYLSGTTGLGLAKMIADNKDNEKIEFVKYTSPVEIKKDYAKGDLDLATLPTNVVPSFSAEAGNRAFSMLAINTLGVLYLLSDDGSTISPSDLSSLSGKTVYVPEASPKMIFKHVLDENGITDVTLDMEYNLDQINTSAQTDPDVHYVLLPEPKVTALLSQQGDKTFTIALDLTAAWANVSEEPVVQGCMIVSKDFAAEHGALIASFLSEYEASINWMKDPANLETAAQYAVDAGVLNAVPVAKKAIPRCNLSFLSGNAMASAANAFFTALGLAAQQNDAYYGAN